MYTMSSSPVEGIGGESIFAFAPWGVTEAGCRGRGGREHLIGKGWLFDLGFLCSGSSSTQRIGLGEGGIGDFYRFLGCCLDSVVPTPEFSDPTGLPHVNKRCVPYIVPEVLHSNLNLMIKRSGYGDFLG